MSIQNLRACLYLEMTLGRYRQDGMVLGQAGPNPVASILVRSGHLDRRTGTNTPSGWGGAGADAPSEPPGAGGGAWGRPFHQSPQGLEGCLGQTFPSEAPGAGGQLGQTLHQSPQGQPPEAPPCQKPLGLLASRTVRH